VAVQMLLLSDPQLLPKSLDVLFSMKKPAWHFCMQSHIVGCPLSTVVLSNGHSLQNVVFKEYFPLSHSMQSVFPACVLKDPISQFRQADIPFIEAKLPALHATHVVLLFAPLEVEYKPSAHSSQSKLLFDPYFVLNVPLLHDSHPDFKARPSTVL